MAEARVGGLPHEEGSLLGEEDSEEHDTFDKSRQDDGEREDRAGGTGVAAGGFCGFGTKEADADGSTECGCGDGEVPGVKIAGGLSEEFEWHGRILVGCGLPVPTVIAMVELEKC